MAGKQPTELTIEGVTLVFSGFEMPAKTTGKGASKNDLIVAAIRDNAIAGQPVWMQGTKTSAVAGLKKKYPDIHFETRGGKENPSVYATVRKASEELVSA